MSFNQKNSSDIAYLFDGIDLVSAAMSHVEWRHRLKSHIEGNAVETWSPNFARTNNCCDLGLWLTGTGKLKYAHLSAFQLLENGHNDFHFYAGLTLTCLLEGHQDEADALLKNEFSQATRRILIAINEMNEALSNLHRLPAQLPG